MFEKSGLKFPDPQERAGVLAVLFAGIKEEDDPRNLVSEFRQNTERILQNLDAQIVPLLTNEADRTMWACVMRICVSKLRTITMNLAVWGTSEWSWEEVNNAMGYIRATIESGEIAYLGTAKRSA